MAKHLSLKSRLETTWAVSLQSTCMLRMVSVDTGVLNMTTPLAADLLNRKPWQNDSSVSRQARSILNR